MSEDEEAPDYKPLTAAQIVEEDRHWKSAASPSFEEDATNLLAIYEGRARSLIFNYIKSLALGDKSNTHPPSPNLCRRLVEQLAVVYRTPPTRRLSRDRRVLADDATEVLDAADAYRASRIDTVMRRADHYRALLRQCVIVLNENHELRRVTARVYPPQCVFRAPSAAAADVIDQDRAVAFLVRAGGTAEASIYEVWNRSPEGWIASIENGKGEAAGESPYPEGVPFAVAPFLVLYDEDPIGAAWLPVDQSLLDSLLNVAAMYCDLVYLVAMETWTLKVGIGLDPYAPPAKVGPDKVVALPAGTDLKLLAHSPQIEDAQGVIQTVLSGMALAHALAPNAFDPDRAEMTGAALRAADRLVDARRVGQVSMAELAEADLWRKFVAIHNTFAGAWGVPKLDPKADLVATFSEPTIPNDAEQDQRVALADMQAGLLSPIAYVQRKLGLSRERAIAYLLAIPGDRVLVGWTPNAQPAGASAAGGPKPALGPGSATKDPDATNLDAASNNEQGSKVGAVVAGA